MGSLGLGLHRRRQH
ncbi:MAG: hypothetical protein ACKOWR_00110 [Micrococcales bacterium]